MPENDWITPAYRMARLERALPIAIISKRGPVVPIP